MSEIFPPSESEREYQEAKPVSSTTTTPKVFKSKWVRKVTVILQPISHFMHAFLSEEAAKNLDSSSTSQTVSSFTLLNRLQVQQNNSIHLISHLISVNSVVFISTPPQHFSPEVPKPQLLQKLKDQGYVSLATKLSLHSGYPWDNIEKIQHPILMEQLIDIYLLSCHQMPASLESQTAIQKIVDFALYIAQSTAFSDSDRINDTKQMLGQFIYLINKDPLLVMEMINTPVYQDALENIKNEFSLHMEEVCHDLQSHYMAHTETPLQDPEIALHTRIPIEIAKALLTDIGTINSGIIDALSTIFLSQDKQHINYEANLSYALTLLQRSPKLRAEFEKLQSPRSNQTASHEIIKVSLGLPPDHVVNQEETRLTILMGLLSHLRQGEDRSCFAVSLAIEILSTHLSFCLKDLRQLLEEGKLTRHTKGIRKDIPFFKRISDENFHKTITFNTQGNLIIHGQMHASLWEAPGIQAVCQAIGLADTQSALLATIQHLSPVAGNENHSMEIKSLIQKICEYALHQQNSPNLTLEDMYTQACFAFSSQTAQPLLKIWENAIASMAEAEEGSMVKTAVLETTLDALQFKLGELGFPPSLFLQRFFLHIQKLLYKKVRFQYDPALLNLEKSPSHIKDNAFVLYNPKKQRNAEIKEGAFVLYNQTQRIDNEKAFRQFILDILLEVKTKMSSVSLSDSENNEFKQVWDVLTAHLQTNEFIGYLLARYHPANKGPVSQLSHGYSLDYENLQFTPWTTQIGNNSKALLKIYFESEKDILTERFVPSGAEDALTHLIDMCKRMTAEEKQLYLHNPNKLKPLCILGKHRLPFMAGNPSLASAWQQEGSTKEWIERSLIKPGREIAKTPLDPVTKQNLIEHLQEHILPNSLSASDLQVSLSLIKKIPAKATIKEYRDHLVKIFQNSPFFISNSVLEKLTRQIDTALCQSLEPALKEKLEKSAVHFADTNWFNGIQDIHFCFVVNPGSGQLELCEAYANGSYLMTVDQNYWLFNQKWEFMTIQGNLAPDDFSCLADS